MKALVTGAAGFLGRHFTAELRARGWDVTQVDVDHAGLGLLEWIQEGDDSNRHHDLVVHAAAVAPHRAAIDGRPATLLTNQLLDAAVLDWAVQSGLAGRVLYISSCAALDAEPDAYGLLKLTGERMAGQARAAGVPVTVVRPFSGYGEDQSENFPFGAFAARARRRDNPFEVWGSGGQVRDWIHVDDVVRGALAVAESGTAEPVSLCTGRGTSMRALAQLLCDAADYGPTLQHLMDRPAGQPHRVGDPTALLRYYTPTVTLEQGVKRALA